MEAETFPGGANPIGFLESVAVDDTGQGVMKLSSNKSSVI